MRTPILILLLSLLPAPAFAVGGEGTINYIRQHNGDCDLAWHGDPSHEGDCRAYAPPGSPYGWRAQRREGQ